LYHVHTVHCVKIPSKIGTQQDQGKSIGAGNSRNASNSRNAKNSRRAINSRDESNSRDEVTAGTSTTPGTLVKAWRPATALLTDDASMVTSQSLVFYLMKARFKIKLQVILIFLSISYSRRFYFQEIATERCFFLHIMIANVKILLNFGHVLFCGTFKFIIIVLYSSSKY